MEGQTGLEAEVNPVQPASNSTLNYTSNKPFAKYTSDCLNLYTSSFKKGTDCNCWNYKLVFRKKHCWISFFLHLYIYYSVYLYLYEIYIYIYIKEGLCVTVRAYMWRQTV